MMGNERASRKTFEQKGFRHHRLTVWQPE